MEFCKQSFLLLSLFESGEPTIQFFLEIARGSNHRYKYQCLLVEMLVDNIHSLNPCHFLHCLALGAMKLQMLSRTSKDEYKPTTLPPITITFLQSENPLNILSVKTSKFLKN